MVLFCFGGGWGILTTLFAVLGGFMIPAQAFWQVAFLLVVGGKLRLHYLSCGRGACVGSSSTGFEPLFPFPMNRASSQVLTLKGGGTARVVIGLRLILGGVS